MKTLILTTTFKAAMTSAILMTLLLAGFSLQAAESEPSAGPEPSAGSEPSASTGEDQNTKPDTTTTEQRATTEPPQAENLRNRELGAAFRQFRPSEEISADNAVPFPVDI